MLRVHADDPVIHRHHSNGSIALQLCLKLLPIVARHHPTDAIEIAHPRYGAQKRCLVNAGRMRSLGRIPDHRAGGIINPVLIAQPETAGASQVEIHLGRLMSVITIERAGL